MTTFITQGPDARCESRRIERLEISRISTDQAAADARVAAKGQCTVLLVTRGRARTTAPVGLDECTLTVLGDGAHRVHIEPRSEVHVASLPIHLLGADVSALPDVSGAVTDAGSGIARMLSSALLMLSDEADNVIAHPARLVDQFAGLVGLVCLEALRCTPRQGRGRLLEAAMEYIEHNLGELDLSADVVARAQTVSTRTLHRSFEAAGLTVSGWVRERRLEHCRRDLIDPTLAKVTVSRIGARWALWDPAHLSRLFKSAYGMSPRAYREIHAHTYVQSQVQMV